MNPIDKLARAAERVLAEHGFKLLHFSPCARLKGSEDSPVFAQMVAEYDPEGAKKPDPIEIQVVQAMKDSHQDRLREQADEARKDLEDFDLDKPGREGFL